MNTALFYAILLQSASELLTLFLIQTYFCARENFVDLFIHLFAHC